LPAIWRNAIGFAARFLSQQAPGSSGGVERIQYHLRGGATQQTHFFSRTFENRHLALHALYEALEARPDIQPDLICRPQRLPVHGVASRTF